MKMLMWHSDEGTLPVRVYADAAELGAELARDILGEIQVAASAQCRYLLGCPGGRSLRSTYLSLGDQARQAGIPLRHVVIVMMDDYVQVQGQQYIPCPPECHYSCRRFALREIRDVLNAGRSIADGVPADQVWVPDPIAPAEYDRRIATAGGVDLFLIASGASDGHVAFNPPGTPLDSASRLVTLAESTRRDNLRTFPQFASLAEVPEYGVSVGLGTIATLSRRVVLVIHGSEKNHAVRKLASLRDFTSEWPASVIYRCRHPLVLLDHAAADEEARA